MTRPECQRCREQMDDLLNSELSVETTQEILRHVERCDDCRAELERRQTVRRLLQHHFDPSLPPTLRTRVMQALASSPAATVHAGHGETRSSRILNALRRKQHPTSRTAQSSSTRLPWIQWRPSAVGLTLAAVLVAFVWWAGQGQPVSAAELLTRSTHAERELTAQPTISIHRTFNFEERVLPSGVVVTRRRIDVWRNGRTGLTARRAFDDRNRLVAAEWTRADGSSTVYEAGIAPTERSASTGAPGNARVTELLESRELWRLDVSASQFVALAPTGRSAEVRQTADEYEISYTRSAPDSAGLSAATLIMRRSDLRSVRATLVVAQGRDLREYRFVERAFEPVPNDRVNASVFELDAELTTLAAKEVVSPAAPSRLPAAATRRMWRTRIVELDPALEIDALYALHQIGADLRERPQVTRADGSLDVQANVASEQRQTELLAALAPIAQHPSVRIDIRVDSALSPPVPVAPAVSSIPSAEALRRYFGDFLSRRLPADQPLVRDQIASAIDDAVTRMAARVQERASNARQHALALSELVQRFGTLTPAGLSPNATATWQTMIRDHARAVMHETEALRLELQPVFFATAMVGDAKPVSDLANPEELAVAVRRLATLADVHDRAVQNAFGIGGGPVAALSVDTETFWRSLLELEHMAADFDRPWNLSK